MWKRLPVSWELSHLCLFMSRPCMLLRTVTWDAWLFAFWLDFSLPRVFESLFFDVVCILLVIGNSWASKKCCSVTLKWSFESATWLYCITWCVYIVYSWDLWSARDQGSGCARQRSWTKCLRANVGSNCFHKARCCLSIMVFHRLVYVFLALGEANVKAQSCCIDAAAGGICIVFKFCN